MCKGRKINRMIKHFHRNCGEKWLFRSSVAINHDQLEGVANDYKHFLSGLSNQALKRARNLMKALADAHLSYLIQSGWIDIERDGQRAKSIKLNIDALTRAVSNSRFQNKVIQNEDP